MNKETNIERLRLDIEDRLEHLNGGIKGYTAKMSEVAESGEYGKLMYQLSWSETLFEEVAIAGLLSHILKCLDNEKATIKAIVEQVDGMVHGAVLESFNTGTLDSSNFARRTQARAWDKTWNDSFDGLRKRLINCQ